MQAPSAMAVPRSEIARRIGALQGQLARKGLDAALILQTADLFDRVIMWSIWAPGREFTGVRSCLRASPPP